MTPLNIGVAIAFILGVIALVASFNANKASSFDDGSFIMQMILMGAGGLLILGALIIKFIASLFG